jgi:hypothetical protein
LDFRGKGEIAGSVKLGEKANIGSNIYASLADTVVHMVGASIKTNAAKSLFDWRDKKALHFKQDDVREIHLQSPQGSFHFIKEGADWRINGPITARAENHKVTNIMLKLRNTNIKSVAVEETMDMKRFGLKKPAYKVDLFSGTEKAKSTVSFSDLEGNKAYGKDEVRPHIFTVDSSFMAPFNQSLFDFRYKKITEFDTKAADSLSIFYKNSLMTLKKDSADKWIFSSGEKTKSWQVTSMLSALSNLQAVKFAAENTDKYKKYGLDNPQGRFEVFSSGVKICELHTGSQKNNSIFARNALSTTVVTIDDDKLKRLFLAKDDLLDEVEKTETGAVEE